jgi:hypothetical protein
METWVCSAIGHRQLKVRAIQSDRAAGKSLRTIAQEHGVGHTTVARICAEAAP